jgi:hypothetical protein
MKHAALSFVAGCVLCASLVAAQEPSRGPDGRTSVHVSGIEVLPIPGKPFSGKDCIEWTRTLEDGTTVDLHLEAVVARDSQGRIYRERHNFVPANSPDKSPLYEIHLYDPVTRTQLLCSGRAYRCVLSDYTPRTFFDTTPEGTYANGTRTLKRVRLGSDVIDGIYVLGTRETVTINPETMGNDRPLVSTREYWYSDELQTNLAVTRIEPGQGKQVIRITGLTRSEPDPHLWDVPIGFTVRDMRSTARQRR